MSVECEMIVVFVLQQSSESETGGWAQHLSETLHPPSADVVWGKMV